MIITSLDRKQQYCSGLNIMQPTDPHAKKERSRRSIARRERRVRKALNRTLHDPSYAPSVVPSVVSSHSGVSSRKSRSTSSTTSSNSVSSYVEESDDNSSRSRSPAPMVISSMEDQQEYYSGLKIHNPSGEPEPPTRKGPKKPTLVTARYRNEVRNNRQRRYDIHSGYRKAQNGEDDSIQGVGDVCSRVLGSMVIGCLDFTDICVRDWNRGVDYYNKERHVMRRGRGRYY